MKWVLRSQISRPRNTSIIFSLQPAGLFLLPHRNVGCIKDGVCLVGVVSRIGPLHIRERRLRAARPISLCVERAFQTCDIRCPVPKQQLSSYSHHAKGLLDFTGWHETNILFGFELTVEVLCTRRHLDPQHAFPLSRLPSRTKDFYLHLHFILFPIFNIQAIEAGPHRSLIP
jgi:hypothetical protein